MGRIDRPGWLGRVGWLGVITVLGLWLVGWCTRTEPLWVTVHTRTGAPTALWLWIHAGILVGTAAAVGVKRIPTRQGVMLGTLLAVTAMLGIAACRVAADMSPNVPGLLGVVGVLVWMLGAGPPAIIAGAVGGWLGTHVGRARSTAFEPSVDDRPPLHLSPALRELHDTTQILQSTLRGGRGRLSTMESTLAFGWVQQLGGLGEVDRERVRGYGIEPAPLTALVTDPAAPAELRAQLVEATGEVIERLRAPKTRPGYR